jgi:predicted DNA-binding protein
LQRIPPGWQERLVPLADEAGNLRAYCLEVHDTCVSKLIAGREKDFAFIKELLNRGLAEMETLITRAELVANMPQGNV